MYLCKVSSLNLPLLHISVTNILQKDAFLLLELDIVHLLIVCSDDSNHNLTKIYVLPVVELHSVSMQVFFTIQKCLCKVLSPTLQLTIETSS